MLTNPIFQRVELTFWDTYTRILTENQKARFLIKKTYQFFYQNPAVLIVSFIGLVGFFGLVSGYIIGLTLR